MKSSSCPDQSLTNRLRTAAPVLTILWALVFLMPALQTQAQGKLVESIEIVVDNVSYNYWCGDGIDDGCFIGLGCSAGAIGIIGGGIDPRYKLDFRSLDGNGTPDIPTNCVTYPIKYNDIGGTGECGNGNAYTDTKNRNDVTQLTDKAITSLRVTWDAWEEDGCGGDDDFNNGCANNDERRTTGSVDLPITTFTNGASTANVINGAQGYNVNIDYSWDMADAPIVESATITICVGGAATFNVTSSPTAGGQFSLLTDYNNVTTQVDSRSDAGDLTTNVLNTAGSYTYYVVEKNATNSQSEYCRGIFRTLTVIVVANPTSPTAATASPASGSTVCLGADLSATFNSGSGGSGCTDEFEYSLDGGFSWASYTPGSTINPTNSGTNIVRIRGRRICTESGCDDAATFSTLVQWNVNNDQTAPSLLSASPGTGTTVCIGETVSATFNNGTGGSGCTNEYQASTDGGSNWSSYTPGSPITATINGNGVIIVRGRRLCTDSGCDGTGENWTTLGSWNVGDIQNPVAQCQNITVQLDGSGSVTVDPNLVDNGSTDDCSALTPSISPSTFTCSDIGSNSTTLTVTDGGGNTATCSATITVQDNVAPTAVCQDITVSLDAGGSASIVAGDVDGGSSDNCSLSMLSVSATSFGCGSIGDSTVTLTVTGAEGQTDNCTATVTIDDPLGACSCITQDIDINVGWNMISSYIDPDDPDFNNIIAPISSNLILIKDGDGQVVLPGIFNQIGNWNVVDGYQVKALVASTLTLQCTQVDPAATPISLSAGWSLIAYLRDSPMDATTAWASITGNMVLGKNNAGQVFLPGIFNQIGNLVPGQGYQVKLIAASTLTYPANARIAGDSGTPFTPVKAPTRYTIDRNTGSNATIILPEGSVRGLRPGDEIGVFNGEGVLTGSGVYEGGPLAFAVWGNDPATGDLENMSEGETFLFRVYRPELGVEFEAQAEIAEGDQTFTTNGITVLRSLTSRELIDNAFDQTQIFVYPNPARDVLKVELQLPVASDVLLRVYDLTGRDVLVKPMGHVDQGSSVIDIDVSELSRGKYFYTIDTNDELFNGSFIKIER